jgi:hypothetical protein
MVKHNFMSLLICVPGPSSAAPPLKPCIFPLTARWLVTFVAIVREGNTPKLDFLGCLDMTKLGAGVNARLRPKIPRSQKHNVHSIFYGQGCANTSLEQPFVSDTLNSQ